MRRQACKYYRKTDRELLRGTHSPRTEGATPSHNHLFVPYLGIVDEGIAGFCVRRILAGGGVAQALNNRLPDENVRLVTREDEIVTVM